MNWSNFWNRHTHKMEEPQSEYWDVEKGRFKTPFLPSQAEMQGDSPASQEAIQSLMDGSFRGELSDQSWNSGNGHTAAEDIRRAVDFMNQVQIERQSYSCEIERIYFHQQAQFSMPYFNSFEEAKAYREKMIEFEIRRRIETFVEPFKSPRQIGNKMCVFLTQKEITDIENKTPYTQIYYYRLTVFILHIPPEIYNNPEMRQATINAAFRELEASDYRITTFVVHLDRVGPQERNRILNAQQSPKWDEVPIVEAKEGHIYL